MGGAEADDLLEEARSMTHRNAPLTVLGRQHTVGQVREVGRPIAHVAAEFHIARATLSKWVSRYREQGVAGLEDRSSAPANRPSRLPVWVVELIEYWRRSKKWSARRIARELADGHGIRCCVRTVTRWLDRLGLNRIRDLTPDGEDLRRRGKITARYPGHMIHVDVKKVGRIPDGGGWWAHGRGSAQDKAARKQRPGHVFLHSATDDHTRLTYTEELDDETGITAAGFSVRAARWLARHGITKITRVLTDNGSCYRSLDFATALASTRTRHKRTRPYRPQTNGKVERYHRTMATEWIYVQTWESNEQRKQALADWLKYYNYDRPHTALGG